MTKFAIVGLSCLLPGAGDPQQFWENLVAGTDCRTDAGARLGGPAGSGAAADPHHTITWTRGGWVQAGEPALDGLRLPAAELAPLDTVFHWTVTVARQALRDSGIAEHSPELARTGLVVGNYSFPTLSSSRQAVPLLHDGVVRGMRDAGLPVGQPRPGPVAGAEHLGVSGLPVRVAAQALGLGGPQLALDAACSSALYALQLACSYLETRRADVMLAGAVCAPDPALIHLSFSDLQAYPHNGVSQPFERSSTGITTGQGAGLLAVKRLDDAVEAGDRILAVVEGIGLSNDGSGRHLLCPNVAGQLETYRLAYDGTDVRPEDVDYIECHATGTPLGDSTELAGLEEWYRGRARVPLLGSVKGSLGHLLTVAGFTSLLKAVLAMGHGYIPPTVGVRDPLVSPAGTMGGGNLVRSGVAWPGSGRRHAGISAFGFGGTNAHVILSGPGAAADTEPAGAGESGSAAASAVSLVGLAAHFGRLSTLSEVERAVYDVRPDRRSLPPDRWLGTSPEGDGSGPVPDGAYLSELDVDAIRYQIPPKELAQFNRQHLLMLRVAEAALLDSGLVQPETGVGRGAKPPRRVAVVVALEMDPRTHAHRARLDVHAAVDQAVGDAGVTLPEHLRACVHAAARDAVHEPIAPNEVLSYIGNLVTSRVCSRWNFTGPSFTVMGDTACGASALEVASLLLRDESVEAVLVGAVDLAGSQETVLARLAGGGVTAEWAPGEGAAAVVLRRSAELQPSDREYARLDGLALRHPDGTELDGRPWGATPAAVRDSAREALASARVAPEDVELVQAHAAGLTAQDGAERAGLAEAYPQAPGEPLCTVLASPTTTVGSTGHASALAGVVVAALCLHHGYLPGTPAGRLTAPEGSAFYVPGDSRPWLRRQVPGRRLAAVSVVGSAGTAAHLVLSSDSTVGRTRETAWDREGPVVVPVSAADPAALVAPLQRLRHALVAGEDPVGLAREAMAGLRPDGVRAVLVARDTERLVTDVEGLLKALPQLTSAAGQAEWASPSGSYLTTRPLGPDGKVALVYPGAFTSYVGLAADLFRLFPGLLERVEADCDSPTQALRSPLLWPRSRRPAPRRELMAREQQMLADVPSMLATGTAFAIAGTQLLRDVLGLRVDGALGYSLGESSMLFSSGVWDPASRRDDRLTGSAVFADRLVGRRRTVRELWGLGPEVADRDVWSSHVLLADVDRVQGAVAAYDRLWVTHVNTPRESVVAGDPAQLQHLVEALGCQSARAPAEHVMHCPVVDAELTELTYLNRYPAGPGCGVELFTAGGYRRLETSDPESLAHNIAGTLRSCIDFPRLLSTAYDSGYRYFVEVGPGATCTRWVTESLAGKPHLAVALDRRGQHAGVTVAGLVARLVSHGLPLALERLLPAPTEPAPRSLALRVRVGGASVAERMRDALRPLVGELLEQAPPPADVVPTAQTTPTATAPPTETRPAMTARGRTPVPALSDPGDQTYVVARQPATVPPPPGLPVAKSVVTFRGDRNRASAAGARAAAPASTADLAPESGAHAPTPPGSCGVATPQLRDLVPVQRRPEDQDGQGPARPRTAGAIWDEQDLLEFAAGQVAPVFGPGFADVDGLPSRVRLPEPPYLFVSRVTEVDATPGQLGPARITTEYDVPEGAWYSVDGLVPAAVTIEAGQADLLLISYLGVDRFTRGERYYRLLDSTLAFHGDLPVEGQTLRYEIAINRLVTSGDNLLFFFGYRCFADGELILELKDACAGFFTEEELASSLGIVPALRDRQRREALEPATFKPLARSGKRRLGATDLALLADGRVADVFGPDYDQGGLNPSLRLPDARLRMVDEISLIDPKGGPRQLGHLSAVKQLDPDGWYFRCHFRGDPVLAGSLVAEGGVQILQAYALSLGMQLCLPDARFQTVPGLETSVKVRGQITPETPSIRYDVEVTELTLLPRPTVIADITVYDGDRAIISMQNFGVQLREKPGTPYRPGNGGLAVDLGRRNRQGEKAVINELHLAHAAKGDLATAMGPEFEVYRDSRAPYIPNGDFQFVDRVMAVEGVRGVLAKGSRMVTEYDSPADAWYYADNAAPVMPNCVVMETSLQAAILLGYYLGATLDQPDKQFSIRNLDGKATWVNHVDLRDKTIRQTTRMLSSTSFGDAVLQSFAYELTADGEVFYRGESLFGYFTPEGLAVQAGLDNGASVDPWLDRPDAPRAGARRIDLTTDASYHRDPRGGQLHLPGGQLRVLDSADIVPGGGEHGLGYVRGRRAVTPTDWYFSCHFHRDPVMPGSLGVEAILQAMQLYVLDAGLAADLPDPQFALARGIEMSWRYRGQILQGDGDLQLEVHVKDVRREQDRLLVVGDASLYKPGLRIYELKDVAIEVRAGAAAPRALSPNSAPPES